MCFGNSSSRAVAETYRQKPAPAPLQVSEPTATTDTVGADTSPSADAKSLEDFETPSGFYVAELDSNDKDVYPVENYRGVGYNYGFTNEADAVAAAKERYNGHRAIMVLKPVLVISNRETPPDYEAMTRDELIEALRNPQPGGKMVPTAIPL